MPAKSDAQVRRTKEWMLEALVSLMREKEFSRITVSEIAQRADMDRRTFYRHYQSKEDILTDKIRKLAEVYETLLRGGSPMDTGSIALSFFTICKENQELLMLLHKHQLLPLLLYELNRLFPHYHIKYHLGEDLYAPFDMEYALSYHVGGFWNVLVLWLDNSMDRTPEELAAMVAHMLPSQI